MKVATLLATFVIGKESKVELSPDGLAIKDYVCGLSNQEPAKPFPPLNFCYKFNKEACCLHTQDRIIEEQFNSHMPENCRSQYKAWERLACVGCYP